MTQLHHDATGSTGQPAHQVTPQPLPTQFSVHVADGGSVRYMMLTMVTPAGTTHYFLDKHATDTLINAADTALTQLETGLVLPPSQGLIT